MVNYRKMYHILCTAASEALDTLPRTEANAAGRKLLQRALYTAEELYIESSGDEDEQGQNGQVIDLRQDR